MSFQELIAAPTAIDQNSPMSIDKCKNIYGFPEATSSQMMSVEEESSSAFESPKA